VDKDRADVPLLTESPELGNVVSIERFHGPPAGIPAEDLHARAAQLEGALDREGKTAGNGDVKANSHSKVQMPKSKVQIKIQYQISKVLIPLPNGLLRQR
jgi:hypothetical protein